MGPGWTPDNAGAMNWKQVEVKMLFFDKYGWPVERVKGRWFLNFLRLLIHTRKITLRRGPFRRWKG